jgi:predicted CoA-binding protein
MNVAIVGASDKPDRYAYKAFSMLISHGHHVFPVHPTLASIEGVAVFAALVDVPRPIDTVTLYIGTDRVISVVDDIIALRPRRVICNPGTENPSAIAAWRAAGIEVLCACTLVLLSTDQF